MYESSSKVYFQQQQIQYTINDNFIIVFEKQVKMGLTISQSKVELMRKEKSSARKNPASEIYDLSGIDQQESRQNPFNQIDNELKLQENVKQKEKERMLTSNQKGLNASKKSLKQVGMHTRNSSQLFPSIVVNEPRKQSKRVVQQSKKQISNGRSSLKQEVKGFNESVKQQRQQISLKKNLYKTQVNSLEAQKDKSNERKQQNNIKRVSYKEQVKSFLASIDKSKDPKCHAQNYKNQIQLNQDKGEDDQSLFEINQRYDLENSTRPKKQNQFSLINREVNIPYGRQSVYQNKSIQENQNENKEKNDNQDRSQFQKAYSKYDWTIPKLYQQSEGSAKNKLKPSPSNLILAKSRNLELEQSEEEKKRPNWNNRRQIMNQIALDRLQTADRYPFLNVCISQQKKNEILQNFCS